MFTIGKKFNKQIDLRYTDSFREQHSFDGTIIEESPEPLQFGYITESLGRVNISPRSFTYLSMSETGVENSSVRPSRHRHLEMVINACSWKGLLESSF